MRTTSRLLATVGLVVLAALALAAQAPAQRPTTGNPRYTWLVPYTGTARLTGVVRDYSVRDRYVILKDPDEGVWKVYISPRASVYRNGHHAGFYRIRRGVPLTVQGRIMAGEDHVLAATSATLL